MAQCLFCNENSFEDQTGLLCPKHQLSAGHKFIKTLAIGEDLTDLDFTLFSIYNLAPVLLRQIHTIDPRTHVYRANMHASNFWWGIIDGIWLLIASIDSLYQLYRYYQDYKKINKILLSQFIFNFLNGAICFILGLLASPLTIDLGLFTVLVDLIDWVRKYHSLSQLTAENYTQNYFYNTQLIQLRALYQEIILIKTQLEKIASLPQCNILNQNYKNPLFRKRLEKSKAYSDLINKATLLKDNLKLTPLDINTFKQSLLVEFQEKFVTITLLLWLISGAGLILSCIPGCGLIGNILIAIAVVSYIVKYSVQTVRLLQEREWSTFFAILVVVLILLTMLSLFALVFNFNIIALPVITIAATQIKLQSLIISLIIGITLYVCKKQCFKPIKQNDQPNNNNNSQSPNLDPNLLENKLDDITPFLAANNPQTSI